MGSVVKSIGSAITGSGGQKAASAQADAANKASGIDKYIFDMQRQDLAPYRQAGYTALQNLQNLIYGGAGGGQPSLAQMGGQQPAAGGAPGAAAGQPSLNPAGVQQMIQQNPNYQFQFDQGMQAVQRSAAAGAGLNSGRTLKALTQFGQGVASQGYNSYLDRLAVLAGIAGNNNAQAQGQAAAQNYGNAAAQHAQDYGAARASGYQAQQDHGQQLINAGMFAFAASDSRLKTDIRYVGRENGHRIYSFRYASEPEALYEGVLAQDVARTHPEAVAEGDNGMLMVNYGALGIEMRRVA